MTFFSSSPEKSQSASAYWILNLYKLDIRKKQRLQRYIREAAKKFYPFPPTFLIFFSSFRKSYFFLVAWPLPPFFAASPSSAIDKPYCKRPYLFVFFLSKYRISKSYIKKLCIMICLKLYKIKVVIDYLRVN